MSLILAIEPDRRQVAHLISIVRHVQGAELILADTTERALESIGNNVPDLILVPALLSPQDDAALAAALRVIATAAHVQMLTIPTFATPKPAAKKGVLSAFRRKASNDAPLEGCDPKVFAEEIASYIERANEERAAAQYYEDDQDTVQSERSRAKVTTSEDAFVAAFDEPEPQAAFEAVQAETAESEPAHQEPAYQEPAYQVATYQEPAYQEVAYHAPDYTPVAAAEEAPADVWAEPPVADELIVERPAHGRPIFHEVFSTSETGARGGNGLRVSAADGGRARTAADVAPAGARDGVRGECRDDLACGRRCRSKTAAPLAAAAPAPVEPADDIADIEQAPAFEDMLANFERANLPVIEEVHAEQWMAEPIGAVHDDDVADRRVRGRGRQSRHRPVHRAGRRRSRRETFRTIREPAQALKPFEPVVPVERVEPLPLAAWQAWPRLDWTAPETAAKVGPERGLARSRRPGGRGLRAGRRIRGGPGSRGNPRTLRTRRAAERSSRCRLPPGTLAAARRRRGRGAIRSRSLRGRLPRNQSGSSCMRSLREDIARRRAELTPSEPVAAPPAQVAARRNSHSHRQSRTCRWRSRSGRRSGKTSETDPPIEDEWGLFDPEQCGFAALLDKLDEMTVPPPGPQPRRPS